MTYLRVNLGKSHCGDKGCGSCISTWQKLVLHIIGEGGWLSGRVSILGEGAVSNLIEIN